MSREDKRRYDAALEKVRSEMAVKPKEGHGRDYALGAIGALAEWAAMKYGAAPFAWLAALFFFLGFLDYTKRYFDGVTRTKRLVVYGTVALLLSWVTVRITFSSSPMPPTTLSARVVHLTPIQLKALNVSTAISSFLSGRDVSAPIPKNQPIGEQNISIIGEYERQTVEIYQEVYEHQVKEMRNELAGEGHIDVQLDSIYENPQSSESIRIISEDLQKLGSQDNRAN